MEHGSKVGGDAVGGVAFELGGDEPEVGAHADPLVELAASAQCESVLRSLKVAGDVANFVGGVKVTVVEVLDAAVQGDARLVEVLPVANIAARNVGHHEIVAERNLLVHQRIKRRRVGKRKVHIIVLHSDLVTTERRQPCRSWQPKEFKAVLPANNLCLERGS